MTGAARRWHALWPLALAVASWLLLDRVLEATLAPHGPFLVVVLVSAAAATLAFVAVELVLLGQSAAEVGLAARRAVPELAVGMLVGAAAFASLLAIAALAGWYDLALIAVPSLGKVTTAVATWLCVAVAEELVFRGMIQRRVTTAFGPAVGLAVATLAFAGAHLSSAGDWPRALLLGACGSLLFGVAWLVTRSLWLPIGIHLAWNLVQDLSGGDSLDGPAWATGRVGVPETGIVAAVVSTAVAILLVIRHVPRGARLP